MNPIEWAERGLVPETVIRWGIRRLLRERLRQENRGDVAARLEAKRNLIESFRAAPVAVQTDKANEQHYEVPAELFVRMLGPRLKYSSCLWEPAGCDLAGAEDAMLELTARRADLADGQSILELGCGWGSLSLWMSARFPAARITAVSNSASQRAFIEARAAERGLRNLRVITADMVAFAPPEGAVFDRVVSVEMFEHMRNHRELLARIARWLKPGGRLFVHIFTHREYAYLFVPVDDSDWMSRFFFSGGMMPSDDLLLYCQDDLRIEAHWRVNGCHYARTLDAWLARLDAAREDVRPALTQTYGDAAWLQWFHRWRIFLMACSELFGWDGGNEWFVSHYRLVKP